MTDETKGVPATVPDSQALPDDVVMVGDVREDGGDEYTVLSVGRLCALRFSDGFEGSFDHKHVAPDRLIRRGPGESAGAAQQGVVHVRSPQGERLVWCKAVEKGLKWADNPEQGTCPACREKMAEECPFGDHRGFCTHPDCTVHRKDAPLHAVGPPGQPTQCGADHKGVRCVSSKDVTCPACLAKMIGDETMRQLQPALDAYRHSAPAPKVKVGQVWEYGGVLAWVNYRDEGYVHIRRDDPVYIRWLKETQLQAEGRLVKDVLCDHKTLDGDHRCYLCNEPASNPPDPEMDRLLKEAEARGYQRAKQEETQRIVKPGQAWEYEWHFDKPAVVKTIEKVEHDHAISGDVSVRLGHLREHGGLVDVYCIKLRGNFTHTLCGGPVRGDLRQAFEDEHPVRGWRVCPDCQGVIDMAAEDNAAAAKAEEQGPSAVASAPGISRAAIEIYDDAEGDDVCPDIRVPW